eukprot:gene9459-6641_t
MSALSSVLLCWCVALPTLGKEGGVLPLNVFFTFSQQRTRWGTLKTNPAGESAKGWREGDGWMLFRGHQRHTT